MMRRFEFPLLILLCVFIPYCAFAQIGKDYQRMTVEGPVERIQYKVTYNVPGQEEGPSPFDHTMKAWVEGSKVMKLETSSANAVYGTSIVELEWKDDVLRAVREYEQSSSLRKILDQQNLTTLGPDGRILTENIFFGKDDLRATMQYAYSTSSAGNEVLEMTMYKPDNLDPQGYYYIESDQWGEVLHIEAVGQDTGLYIQRLENVGDSLFISRMFVSSRQRRGEKDTLKMTTLVRYDQYGNPTYSKVSHLMETAGENAGEQMEIITQVAYTYEGDQVQEDEADVMDLQARWFNDAYNINITLQSNGKDYGGLYFTNKLREKDPEIVEEGSDWLFKLRDSMTGNWEFDTEKETIRFFQNDKLVVELKVKRTFWEISLQEDRPYSANISFKKN